MRKYELTEETKTLADGAEAAQICGEIGEMVGREAACKQSVTNCNRFGNAAKMREALESFNAVDLSGFKFPLDGDSSTIYNSNKKDITIPYWRVAELLNGVKAAQDMSKATLSAPPRNCDRFSNANEALEAFANEKGETLIEFVRWLFAEAKGESK